MVLDENEDRLVRVSSCGISEAYLNKGPVFVDSRYCSLDTGRVERVEDLQSDDRVQYPEAARREGLTSLLAVPVKYRETPVGVIRLYHTGRMPVSEADIDSLCVVASLLGLVIENNELRGFLEPVKRVVESLPSRISKA
jgi:GAF domain-containing protein